MTFFAKISLSAISSYCKVFYNSMAECFLALEFRNHSEGFWECVGVYFFGVYFFGVLFDHKVRSENITTRRGDVNHREIT